MTDPVRDSEPTVDRQMLDLTQRAGLDSDLNSKVPPRYGASTVAIMLGILVVIFIATIWAIF